MGICVAAALAVALVAGIVLDTQPPVPPAAPGATLATGQLDATEALLPVQASSGFDFLPEAELVTGGGADGNLPAGVVDMVGGGFTGRVLTAKSVVVDPAQVDIDIDMLVGGAGYSAADAVLVSNEPSRGACCYGFISEFSSACPVEQSPPVQCGGNKHTDRAQRAPPAHAALFMLGVLRDATHLGFRRASMEVGRLRP